MKRYILIGATIAIAAAAVTSSAFAQGFGGGGGGGAGFIAQAVATALNYVVLPMIDIAIIFHAGMLMMGGHRMTAIFEAACGLTLIAMHTQIVGMVPV